MRKFKVLIGCEDPSDNHFVRVDAESAEEAEAYAKANLLHKNQTIESVMPARRSKFDVPVKKIGRPKGSKNKPKDGEEAPKKKNLGGRPKGSKNKPKGELVTVPKPLDVFQRAVSAAEGFQAEVKETATRLAETAKALDAQIAEFLEQYQTRKTVRSDLLLRLRGVMDQRVKIAEQIREHVQMEQEATKFVSRAKEQFAAFNEKKEDAA
jgi:hypothetical protein